MPVVDVVATLPGASFVPPPFNVRLDLNLFFGCVTLFVAMLPFSSIRYYLHYLETILHMGFLSKKEVFGAKGVV